MEIQKERKKKTLHIPFLTSRISTVNILVSVFPLFSVPDCACMHFYVNWKLIQVVSACDHGQSPTRVHGDARATW